MDIRSFPDDRSKIGQVKSNLRSWRWYEWAIIWGLVPALLLAIYALPQSLKDRYFIFNTLFPWRIQTWFLSSYTHSQVYPHLAGNLAFYLVTLLMIFAFESSRRRFWIVASWSFCIVPFIGSGLTILLWSLFGKNAMGQGFSAINGAFLAYAMFIFVVWGLRERLVVFNHPELFPGTRVRFLVVQLLLAVLLALIVVMSLLSGIFTDTGGSVSNGIAHFGGFITSLGVLLVLDLKEGKRRYFDAMLGLSILVGILWYGYYLASLVMYVKSG
jgi:hypothetical protein